MKRMGGEWTEPRLYSFIRHPMLTAPGTKMVFERVTDAQGIADLIAYLRGLKE